MSEHIHDDALVLHYYGESNEMVESHLARCVDCRGRYRQVQLVLNSVEDPLPERGSGYEQSVWSKLEPEIRRTRWRLWLRPSRWAPAAAVAGMLVAAFWVGRYSGPPAPVERAAAPGVQERVLQAAVGDHLERSQMVLAEIANQKRSGEVDLRAERAVARNLVGANRMYRQTAAVAGDEQIAAVLDDLERVLLEIAHSPEEAPAAQLSALRQRIEEEDLVFKVRVLGARLRTDETRRLRAANSDRL